MQTGIERYNSADSLVRRASIRPGMSLLLVDPTPELAACVNRLEHADTLIVWMLDSMRDPASLLMMRSVRSILTHPRIKETISGLNYDFRFDFDRVFSPAALHASAWSWVKPGGAVCLDSRGAEHIGPLVEEWAESMGGFTDPVAKTIVVYKPAEF